VDWRRKALQRCGRGSLACRKRTMRAGWGYCEASSVLFRIVPRAIDVTAAGGAGVGAGGAKVQEQAWARVAEPPKDMAAEGSWSAAAAARAGQDGPSIIGHRQHMVELVGRPLWDVCERFGPVIAGRGSQCAQHRASSSAWPRPVAATAWALYTTPSLCP
jgi:hypothetical protein